MNPRRLFTHVKTDRLILSAVVLAIVALVVALRHVAGFVERTSGQDSTASALVAMRSEQQAHRAEPYAVPTGERSLVCFDPNTADSTLLLGLGLQPFQVRAIYRYRAKGGVFRRPDDLARLYGLTAGQFRRLRPYIRISADYLPAAEVYARESEVHTRSADTLCYPVKLRNSERIELNAADSALLVRVPGIGGYYARRIADYRRRLGGYAHAEQLLEIDDFPPSAIPFFTVDARQIKPLDVNKLTLSQLKRHPYINYLQARAICDYRRLRGTLTSINQLRLLPDFSPSDIERLRPYLSF